MEVSSKSQVREVRLNAHVMLCITRALLGNTSEKQICRAFYTTETEIGVDGILRLSQQVISGLVTLQKFVVIIKVSHSSERINGSI